MGRRAKDRGHHEITKGETPLKMQAIRERLAELFKEKNYDPAKELIDLAQHPRIPIEIKIAIHKEMLKYVAPQLKSVDIQANVKGGISISIVKFGDTLIEEAKQEALEDNEEENEVIDIPKPDGQ